MNRAAIVLAGGMSRRMGQDKASLPFGGRTLLERTVDVAAQAAPRVVVVRAADQDVALARTDVIVARDREPFAGPLAALREGLAALDDADAAVAVLAVDLPFVTTALLDHLFAALESSGADAAVPQAGGRLHPLAACYRASLLPRVESLLAAGSRSLRALLDAVPVRIVAEDELARIDQGARALVNLNTPEDYRRALDALPPPA